MKIAGEEIEWVMEAVCLGLGVGLENLSLAVHYTVVNLT